MKQLEELVRPNIWRLEPYSSARDEYKGKRANVFLDANENPFPTQINRYPDPRQLEVKRMISQIKPVKSTDQIFLGNGSDEPIDLVFRIFCRPGVDNVVAIEPTYGMYSICAHINDVEYRRVHLTQDWQIDEAALSAAIDNHTKLLFFCSPNNPIGNSLDMECMRRFMDTFDGIVIIDEAYIDFSSNPSFLLELDHHPNLIVLQTFSKAWGMAGIRLGMAFASPEIIELMTKVKYPYNINQLTQTKAMECMSDIETFQRNVQNILSERERVMEEFSRLSCCKEIFPSDANFFLARVTSASAIYNYLVDHGIIVRNRSHVQLCQECLRITIGTPEENRTLLTTLQSLA